MSIAAARSAARSGASPELSGQILLGVLVTGRCQRRGVGTELVARAVTGAREAGCGWLHVDYDDHLRAFSVDACGVTPTDAGPVHL